MAIQGAREDAPALVPHLFVKDAAGAIAFYQTVFDAGLLYRAELPGGAGEHAQLQVGNSTLMLTTEMPSASAPARSPQTLGAVSAIVEIYVEDVDALVDRAVDAGAQVVIKPQDWFFGDRYAQIRDPHGHLWGIATVRETLSGDEVERRAR